RDSARSGEYAYLAHAATEHFAVDAGFFDEGVRTDNHGADGRAEAFRKAEHHGVKVARDFGDLNTECGGCVEYARAVEMDFQSRSVSAIADLIDLRGGIERASRHIVRIFEAHQSGLRIII